MRKRLVETIYCCVLSSGSSERDGMRSLVSLGGCEIGQWTATLWEAAEYGSNHFPRGKFWAGERWNWELVEGTNPMAS